MDKFRAKKGSWNNVYVGQEIDLIWQDGEADAPSSAEYWLA